MWSCEMSCKYVLQEYCHYGANKLRDKREHMIRNIYHDL